MIKEPQTLKDIGSAWVLYFRLVLVEGGNMVGTYDDIGLALGTNGKTVRNWVKSLERAGIIKCAMKGHQVSIDLIGKHLTIAQAPDSVVVRKESDAPPMSPRMQSVAKIVEAADEAKAKIEIRMAL